MNRCLALMLIALLGPYPANAAADNTEGDFVRQSDVIYGRTYGLALTMEVFRPLKPNGRGVIWVVSSGGYSDRDRTLQATFEARLRPLLQRGYTIFAAIHGSSPLFNLQDYRQHVQRAVRFVRYHASDYAVDAGHLALAGSSSGGVIALLVAMTPDEGLPTAGDPVERMSSRVQAAAAFFPGTDLANFGQPGRRVTDALRQSGNVDPGFQFYEIDARTGIRRPVTADEEILNYLRELSPITHVSADAPPTILIHGDADQATPLEQSERFISKLTAMRVSARLVVRTGKGHAWPGWEADSAEIADWFDLHTR